MANRHYLVVVARAFQKLRCWKRGANCGRRSSCSFWPDPGCCRRGKSIAHFDFLLIGTKILDESLVVCVLSAHQETRNFHPKTHTIVVIVLCDCRRHHHLHCYQKRGTRGSTCLDARPKTIARPPPRPPRQWQLLGVAVATGCCCFPFVLSWVSCLRETMITKARQQGRLGRRRECRLWY